MTTRAALLLERLYSGTPTDKLATARRLHTVMERVLDEVSFDATDREDLEFRVTADYVRRQLTDISENEDLSRYIL